MRTTVKTKSLGVLTFSRPGIRYVYVDLNGMAGTLGNQICRYGTFSGDTIVFTGDNQVAFDRLCRLWVRSFLKKNRGQRHDKD
tara:strand:+ start:325 stop:573 length:249 start_codon:yes stop_codon:yes gene_type:complete